MVLNKHWGAMCKAHQGEGELLAAGVADSPALQGPELGKPENDSNLKRIAHGNGEGASPAVPPLRQSLRLCHLAKKKY